MQNLSAKQLWLLVTLTVVWGLNWPVMKLGVTGMPPLQFRTMSMWLGLPVLALAMWWLKVPFTIERKDWPELRVLTISNMFIWHVCIILAIQSLTSGRAAILGYTMPIFSAVLGYLLFKSLMTTRHWLGVLAAAIGVGLLLWHEMTNLSGKPLGVALALIAAAAWAYGTQRIRITTIQAPTMTITFWMMAMTCVLLSVLTLAFERKEWVMPSHNSWASIIYNAVLVFGFAHAAWQYLARSLPPVVSTLSIMLIPILGVFIGAYWLNEVLHWQDWAAVVLMVVAIGSVLAPSRTQTKT